MQSQEIPQDQWQTFFDDFSKRHVGQPVTIELINREYGDQPEGIRLPLVGVSLDPKDSSGQLIEIMVGGQTEADVNHIVRRAVRVLVAKSDDGQDRALEIDCRDQPNVLLNFGEPPYADEYVGNA